VAGNISNSTAVASSACKQQQEQQDGAAGNSSATVAAESAATEMNEGATVDTTAAAVVFAQTHTRPNAIAEDGEEEDFEAAVPQVVTAVAVGDVQDNGDGSYSCSYSHTVAGAYELHVLNGKCFVAERLTCIHLWLNYAANLALHRTAFCTPGICRRR
jgi:hypothetical protein